MCDALQELSDLSLDLQKSDMDLYRKNKKYMLLCIRLTKDKQFQGYITHTTKAAESAVLGSYSSWERSQN
jgi:hypothetical protein